MGVMNMYKPSPNGRFMALGFPQLHLISWMDWKDAWFFLVLPIIVNHHQWTWVSRRFHSCNSCTAQELQEWSQDRIEELAALHAAQQLEALEVPGWAENHQVERHKRKKRKCLFRRNLQNFKQHVDHCLDWWRTINWVIQLGSILIHGWFRQM